MLIYMSMIHEQHLILFMPKIQSNPAPALSDGTAWQTSPF